MSSTVVWLLILSVSSGTVPSIAAEVSLESELRDAEHRVWIAHQQWLVALTGPGVNRVNRGLNPSPPRHRHPEQSREQLKESAWRTLDAAKTIVDGLQARLSGSEAPIGAVSELDQRVDDLPGNVTIRWQPIPGAVTYTVEINVVGRGTDGAWSLWSYVVNLEAPEYTFEIGSGPSRWRVWAVDATDLGGPVSEWSELVPPAATR